MATAMVRRRPHAEKSGRFRLSPGDVVFFGAFFTARRCVERVAQHADIPVPFPALRRCTERDVQHADSSVAPGFRARSVARSGPSVGAQVAYEDSVRCAERDVLLADTSVASSALRTKSFRPPFCLSLLIRRSLNRFRRQWQAEYPMFQNRPRLTLRMYLSMNSRYTNFCCASSLQGNRSAHVLIASRD